MSSAEVQARFQACAVPYRIRDGRAEFCLVAENGESRWTFPSDRMGANRLGCLGALKRAVDAAGLECRLQADHPLDSFPASKVDDADTITAFLLPVETVRDDWPGAVNRRRRWCFAEEAKMRIRRKPMRRLIDLSVRRLETMSRGTAQP